MFEICIDQSYLSHSVTNPVTICNDYSTALLVLQDNLKWAYDASFHQTLSINCAKNSITNNTLFRIYKYSKWDVNFYKFAEKNVFIHSLILYSLDVTINFGK